MIRLALRVFAFTLVATATSAYAADAYFGSTNTRQTGATSTTNGRFKSRLSSDNYLNSVQQLDTQTKNTLNQQVKDLYPKKGATPAIANQPSTTIPNQPAGSITISNPPPEPTPTQQTTTTTTSRPTNTYQSPAAQPAAPQQQTNTYTGFGSGSKGSNAPANSGNSTGLGIKY